MGLDQLEFRRVDSWDDAQDFMRWLGERREWLGFDVETSGLIPFHDPIRFAQFGDGRMGWGLDYPEWKGLVRDVFQTYRGRIVAHNALFDLKMMKADGVWTPQRFFHDTMVMCFLKDPGSRIDLKGAASLYVDQRARAGQSALREFMSGGGFDWGTVPRDAEPYWVYGALDTCLAAMLAEALWPDTGGGPLREAYELNMAVIHVLRDAEVAGLLVDGDYRARAERKLREELAGLEAEIPFEPTKDRQAREYLLSIGAEIHETTPKGDISVDKHVLRRLYGEDPDRFRVANLLDLHRQKSRALGAYIEKFDDVSRGGLAVDGVLRCHAHPVGGLDENGKSTGTRTGRLSVTDPALQTLPKGRIVRDAIVARPGCRILQADYKAMELRALAALAGETQMLEAFDRGEDLHDFVTGVLFGEGWGKKQRSITKNVQFAKCYGAGIEQLAFTAGVPKHEAQSVVDLYDSRFPNVARFMQRTIDSIMVDAKGRSGRGWVTLPDGTRLPVQGSEAYKGVNYCVDPKVRLLMADLTWKEAGDISTGDEVVSFDETRPVGRNQGQRLRTGVVEAVSMIVRPRVRIETDLGDIVSSVDHLWLMSGSHLPDGKRYRRWKSAIDVIPGDRICFFSSPWVVEPTWESGWIAGMMDGEGCLSLGLRPGITFAQNVGPEFDLYHRLMTERGFDLTTHVRPNGLGTIHLTQIGEIARAIGTFAPERFKRRPDLRSLWEDRIIDGRWRDATVQAVVPIARKGQVASIQTSTRTFIADGFMSHNCIQGGTAVAAKRKLVELDAAGVGEFFRLAVHDEFLFEVPEEHVDEAREIVRQVMPDTRTYPGVTLEIDDDLVERWGQHFRGPDYPKYVDTPDPEWLEAL